MVLKKSCVVMATEGIPGAAQGFNTNEPNIQFNEGSCWGDRLSRVKVCRNL